MTPLKTHFRGLFIAEHILCSAFFSVITLPVCFTGTAEKPRISGPDLKLTCHFALLSLYLLIKFSIMIPLVQEWVSSCFLLCFLSCLRPVRPVFRFLIGRSSTRLSKQHDCRCKLCHCREMVQHFVPVCHIMIAAIDIVSKSQLHH